MATIIGVRFKNAGKLYYFDPGELWPVPGDYVIVDTTRGMEYGLVITGVREVSDDMITPPLKTILRIANERDALHAEENERFEKEAHQICLRKIEEHKLDMKLVGVEQTFDNAKLLFYFTANGRVDFRSLVKDLASVFRTRIELRQIGVRDEAKMLGGLGPCGRPICCGSFLGDFQPVSIKMAKEQNLSLNPTKISGVCGRLMCCLKYEEDHYEQTRRSMPKIGKDVETPDGFGTVLDLNILKETVTVRVRRGDTSELRTYPVTDIRWFKPPVQQAPKPVAEAERTNRKPQRRVAQIIEKPVLLEDEDAVVVEIITDEEPTIIVDSDIEPTIPEKEPLTEELDKSDSPSSWQQAVADALRSAEDSTR